MKIRSRSSTLWVYVLIGSLVALGLLIVLGYWIVRQLNTEEQTRVVLTNEALRDRWLALSKFSEDHGISVNTDTKLDAEDMPALSDTIILTDVRSSEVDDSVNAALEDWVLRGGTLIYRVPVVSSTEDPLSALNTQYFPNKLMVFEERESAFFSVWLNWRMQDWRKHSCRTETMSMQFANGDTIDLEESSISPPYLVTSQSPFVEDIVPLSRMFFQKMNWGQGTVYFVTDLDLWSNHHLDCANHAYLFLRLVRGVVAPIVSRTHEIAVWIVPPEPVNMPHILDLLWDNYHIPLIGILITFLVALIARNIRSSPAMHAIPIPRRATIDYVTSVTEFSWRKNDIKRFFQAFQWVSDNPKGVFGPSAASDTGNSTKLATSDTSDDLNDSPETEADLVNNVRKLQAKLRQNMQPSLRQP